MVLWDPEATACLMKPESSSRSFLSAATSPRVTDSSRRRSMAEDGGGGLRIERSSAEVWLLLLHDEKVLPLYLFCYVLHEFSLFFLQREK